MPSWITHTPGVCGGDACIRNTRLQVWLIHHLRTTRGLTPDNIKNLYPQLNDEDLAVVDWYSNRVPNEISEALLAQNEE